MTNGRKIGMASVTGTTSTARWRWKAVICASMLPIEKTATSNSATHGNVDRLPTVIAINEIIIAAAQGQRCSKQSSHGASPPQYCEIKALASTAALATRTKIGKRPGSALMTS